jgi:peptidylprolyl isomerase domain and WD repeat-containing protein 1
VFDFCSGKLHRIYDESIETIVEMQQAGTALQTLEEVEFGRRLAIEREVEGPQVRTNVNVIFDESGHFVLYGSMFGVKVINTLTNRVAKTFGQDENIRPLNLCMYQGQPEKKGLVTVSMAASSNPLLQAAEAKDPMLVCTALGRVRFYLFTNVEEYRHSILLSHLLPYPPHMIFPMHVEHLMTGDFPICRISKSERDVQNEKPRNLAAKAKAQARPTQTGTSAILHTTYGDIHVRLYPDAAPKAVENFVTHARNGYYNNTIFHRVIRKFMIQVRSS